MQPLPQTSGKMFATQLIDSWLNESVTEWIEARRQNLDQSIQLLKKAGTAGSLTTDAQLAALALRCHATVHTADTDFQRFPGVRWHNPILKG